MTLPDFSELASLIIAGRTLGTTCHERRMTVMYQIVVRRHLQLHDGARYDTAQVRAALRRIDNGTYGRCVVDGEPIDAKRHESVPWTPYGLKHELQFEERARIRTPSL